MNKTLLLAAALCFAAAPVSNTLRAGDDHKVMICHIPPGNPENAHEIIVDFHAVPAHVANHGDYLGPCNGIPE
jgi:hypothetical protein